MLYKTTSKLFQGTYQYKIVLICAGAAIFRNKDSNAVLKKLNEINLAKSPEATTWLRRANSIKNQEELNYALSLHGALATMPNALVRVESPWITVYTNEASYIDTLANLSEDNVKYICRPPKNTNLVEGTVLLPKINFDYKVTLGKTAGDYSPFLEWAETSTKVKLTKSCKQMLQRSRSWGGSYFYITGDNMLLVAKMHLGGSIAKVERIIKA